MKIASSVTLAIGCGASPAPRLCTVKAFHARANHYRLALGLSRVPLEPGVWTQPHRRGWYAWLWDRRRDRARAAYFSSSPSAIIRRIFGAAAPAAIAVAECESHLDPLAHNPSGAAGLFQLMPVHWEAQGYDPYNAATNTRIAWHLYSNSGWSAWVCQP